MQPLISAIVCTHNRAPRLRGALASLAAQSLAPGAFEIVVVDNASTDATRATVEAARAAGAPIRYLHEPRLGVSHARNRGWQEARAPLVAFLDDDALAPPDWLARIVAGFAQLAPKPGCLGGPVEPIWEVPRPAWLPDSLLAYLSVLELAQAAGPITRGKFLYGTNASFERAQLAAIGGYSPSLGPIGGWQRSGEDTFVQKQLRARGLALWYDPELRVRHHVPAERATQRWLLRRLYLEGMSRAGQQILEARTSRARLLGVALRKLGSSPRRLAALALPVTSARRFERRASSWRRIGFLMGALGAGARTQAGPRDAPRTTD